MLTKFLFPDARTGFEIFGRGLSYPVFALVDRFKEMKFIAACLYCLTNLLLMKGVMETGFYILVRALLSIQGI